MRESVVSCNVPRLGVLEDAVSKRLYFNASAILHAVQAVVSRAAEDGRTIVDHPDLGAVIVAELLSYADGHEAMRGAA